jgi:Fe2+ or Zn2+ uptake regulation protein
MLDSHSHDESATAIEHTHDCDHDCESTASCGEQTQQDNHESPGLQDEASHHHVLVSDHNISYHSIARNRESSRFDGSEAPFRAHLPLLQPPQAS